MGGWRLIDRDYGPASRGPFPVGVRTARAVDPKRDDRELPVEVWYPADARYDATADVRDAAQRPGRHPLVLYSHASYGHRAQSSFLCTHLASHGYVVAAVDHTGNTAVDFAERSRRTAAGEVWTAEERETYVRRIIADRVPDLRFLLDEMLIRAPGELSRSVDESRVGLIGWSFGGWAALATLEHDVRFRAVLALAPAGNSRPLPGIIPATLTFAWKRQVPAMFLAAGRDRFTPLAGTFELFARTPSRKRMFILRQADHSHFADQVDDETLCTREQAHLFTRTLGVAHMDAVLKDDERAERFLSRDPAGALRARGVDAVEHQERIAD